MVYLTKALPTLTFVSLHMETDRKTVGIQFETVLIWG